MSNLYVKSRKYPQCCGGLKLTIVLFDSRQGDWATRDRTHPLKD